MPLLSVVWFVCSLASLVVWGSAAYFLWSYFEGELVREVGGDIVRVRDEWRLWLGLGLLAWSLLGRFVVTLLIAKPDRSQRRFRRKAGRRISTEAGDLYVEERGARDAPAIILTHGQGLDSTLWSELADELSKRFRVITWDLPGLGKSERVAGSMGPDGAARALRALVRQTAAERAVLVGHSFGGMAIQELAKLDPGFFESSVSGVALLNTTYVNPVRTVFGSSFFSAIQKPVLEPGAHLTIMLQPVAWLNLWQSYLSGWAHLANRIQFSRDVTRRLLEHATLVATRNPPASIERRNLGMYQWNGFKGGINVPTLVLSGGKDLVTKCEAGQEIARLTAGRFQVIDVSNHMGPYEQLEIYGRYIADFAAGLQTARVDANGTPSPVQ